MRAFRMVTVLAVCGLFSMTAVAMDLAQMIDFKIAPQRLATALLEFSHQANVQIVVGSEVGDRRSAGLSGRYSIAQGLTSLLRGSALVYRVINDTSIAVGYGDTSKTPPCAPCRPSFRGTQTGHSLAAILKASNIVRWIKSLRRMSAHYACAKGIRRGVRSPYSAPVRHLPRHSGRRSPAGPDEDPLPLQEG
jgi:hypothetical protein